MQFSALEEIYRLLKKKYIRDIRSLESNISILNVSDCVFKDHFYHLICYFLFGYIYFFLSELDYFWEYIASPQWQLLHWTFTYCLPLSFWDLKYHRISSFYKRDLSPILLKSSYDYHRWCVMKRHSCCCICIILIGQMLFLRYCYTSVLRNKSVQVIIFLALAKKPNKQKKTPHFRPRVNFNKF